MSDHEARLLELGIFTIPVVADLVEAPQRAVRTWVEGRKGKQEPVIDNEIGRLGRTVAVSFTNLMELRFVARFAAAGVRLNAIRAIMHEVRDTLARPHPFATKVVFRTDGRKIVAEIARRNGVEVIYDLKSKNYEMHQVVLESLDEDVIFDPNENIIAWRPRPKIAPNVIVHPHHSFGQPILKSSRIPTETLADAVKAEGSLEVVAALYDVPLGQVREAVSFQRNLRLAA